MIGIDIGKLFDIASHDERGAIAPAREAGRAARWQAPSAETCRAPIPMEAWRWRAPWESANPTDSVMMPGRRRERCRRASKGQKKIDFRDAEAIAEAVQREYELRRHEDADELDLQALYGRERRSASAPASSSDPLLLLERGIAVRQGQRLRAELPRILATPPDVLSPGMARLIEDLAGDWRRLDERIEGLSAQIDVLARAGLRLRAADERTRHRADHLQRDGGRDRRW